MPRADVVLLALVLVAPLMTPAQARSPTAVETRRHRSPECDKCDLRSSYCKHWPNGNYTCECRKGFTRNALTAKCVIGEPARETPDAPLLYTEGGDQCILGQAEKMATRILTGILERYDRNLAPKISGVDVDVELLIQKVTEINEIQSSSKMDILFSQIWHDPGLSFEHEEGAQCVSNLSLSHRMVDSIWLPNVCLVNSKASGVHSSPTPNIFLAILPNGTIWMNYRIVVESPCTFEFTTFPMDQVECTTVFESYSFNVGKVRLFWKRQGVPVEIIGGDINLPDFMMTHFVHEKATFNYPAGVWDQVSYVKAVDVFSFGCLAFIFLTVVELALVGSLEKRNFARVNAQPPEYFDANSASNKDLARRAFQKALGDRSSNTRYRVQRVEAKPTEGNEEWRKSTWANLEDTTFVEFPTQPEVEDGIVHDPPPKSSLPARSPSRAPTSWKRSFRRRGAVKAVAPKLFDKWTGDDLDRFCQKLFPITFAVCNLVYWLYLSAKSR